MDPKTWSELPESHTEKFLSSIDFDFNAISPTNFTRPIRRISWFQMNENRIEEVRSFEGPIEVKLQLVGFPKTPPPSSPLRIRQEFTVPGRKFMCSKCGHIVETERNGQTEIVLTNDEFTIPKPKSRRLRYKNSTPIESADEDLKNKNNLTPSDFAFGEQSWMNSTPLFGSKHLTPIRLSRRVQKAVDRVEYKLRSFCLANSGGGHNKFCCYDELDPTTNGNEP